MINAHGGTIRVESREGEWTEFVFTLPNGEKERLRAMRSKDESPVTPVLEEPLDVNSAPQETVAPVNAVREKRQSAVWRLLRRNSLLI